MEPTAEDMAALDRVVARTRHERFRQLLDPAHPDYEPAYWAVIRQMDGQPMPEPAPKPRVALGTPHCRECTEKRKNV